jgi:excinuclease ABC subunit B
LRKKIGDITDLLAREDADTDALLAATGDARKRGQAVPLGERNLKDLPSSELASLIEQLTAQMHASAADLQFEVAARLRDEIGDLKKELRQMLEATA